MQTMQTNPSVQVKNELFTEFVSIESILEGANAATTKTNQLAIDIINTLKDKNKRLEKQVRSQQEQLARQSAKMSALSGTDGKKESASDVSSSNSGENERALSASSISSNTCREQNPSNLEKTPSNGNTTKTLLHQ